MTSLPATAGALSVAAGLVHAAAAGAHAEHPSVVLLFAVTAAVQVGVGALLIGRPSRLALLGGAGVNLAAAAAWAVSRTAGLPLIEELAQREAVGVQDVTATALEVVAATLALAAVRAAAPSRPAWSPVLLVALVPAMVGMAAPATHVDGVEHHEVAAAGTDADPVFSGADTSRASPAQLEAAKRLIETTRAAAARFGDQASLLAAGYQSIGDGLLTPYDHFIRPDYMNDGRELDPNRIESIVMERTPTGWRVASAMYILEAGRTMADVPDIAGELTTWHDHQNLCWDPSGTRLAGLLLNGRCFPGGTLRPTPPMLHVWLQDHPCGPFAGIEGHGQGCAHGH